MRIKLYGLPTCSRCKMAKRMLEKRNIYFDYFEVQKDNPEVIGELPQMFINGVMYEGKDVLLEIRKMKRRD